MKNLVKFVDSMNASRFRQEVDAAAEREAEALSRHKEARSVFCPLQSSHVRGRVLTDELGLSGIISYVRLG